MPLHITKWVLEGVLIHSWYKKYIYIYIHRNNKLNHSLLVVHNREDLNLLLHEQRPPHHTSSICTFRFENAIWGRLLIIRNVFLHDHLLKVPYLKVFVILKFKEKNQEKTSSNGNTTQAKQWELFVCQFPSQTRYQRNKHVYFYNRLELWASFHMLSTLKSC